MCQKLFYHVANTIIYKLMLKLRTKKHRAEKVEAVHSKSAQNNAKK